MEPIKKFSPAFYGLIILLFFLPFVNLSCSGQTIMSLTGFQLITGAEYSSQNMFGQNMSGQMNGAEVKDNKEIKAQPFALFAFLAALVGLALSFIKKKSIAMINLVVSVLGAVFLLILKFNIDGDVELSGQNMIKLEYQAGYWLSFLLFLGAALVYWLIFNEKQKIVVASNDPPAPTIG